MLQNGSKRAEDTSVAEQQKSPFARVSNGYDPKQVAAFAAEALNWKKELAALRSEVAAAAKLVERYESVIGSIEEVEREAAEIIEDAERRAAALIEDAGVRSSKLIEEAEDEAARILEMARDRVDGTPEVAASPFTGPVDDETDDGDEWLTPDQSPDQSPEEIPDAVEQIFEPVEQIELPQTDLSLERRAAGAANLWKRRGVVAPSE